MASRPWSEQDLAVLEECAETYDLASACRRISDRSVTAIKVRMSKLRAELGCGDGRTDRGGKDDQEDFNREAVPASQALLAATLRVGVWS